MQSVALDTNKSRKGQEGGGHASGQVSERLSEKAVFKPGSE